ncbi:hypothetical protein JCM19298_904 [Nonlabens ulvanivorans]|nr:hypothetical protein [Nonlabens ulvanivorans]GAK95127.1 hypothetical protein JCM19298_904 [Nonlabens ulvanivorans]
MKKLFLLAFTCLAIISCEKEEILHDKSAESMMTFKDLEDFTKTLSNLNKITDNNEILNWVNNNNPNALYFSNDSDIKNNVPRLMQLYLNKNKKCLIGNKILILTGNELRLSLKNSLSDYEIIGSITEETTDINEPSLKSTNISELRKEYEQYNRVYYRNGCNPRFNKSLKYRLVHELKIKKHE